MNIRLKDFSNRTHRCALVQIVVAPCNEIESNSSRPRLFVTPTPFSHCYPRFTCLRGGKTPGPQFLGTRTDWPPCERPYIHGYVCIYPAHVEGD